MGVVKVINPPTNQSINQSNLLISKSVKKGMHIKINSEFGVEGEVKGQHRAGGWQPPSLGCPGAGENPSRAGTWIWGGWWSPWHLAAHWITPQSTNGAFLGWINREYQVEQEGRDDTWN